MKKLVFISNMAAPYQVKFSTEIQKYFEAEFWFYIHVDNTRPKWWKYPLGNYCSILKNVWFKRIRKYFTFDVIKKLDEFNPDIVMLGAFRIPGNYLAYLWARKNNKKIILFTELLRTRKGKTIKFNLFWKVVKYLYKDIDILFVAKHKKAIQQLKYDFGFGDKVAGVFYPLDLDNYFEHPLRNEKKIDHTIIFPHRLIDIYNPLFAIDIFNELLKEYPNIKLKMNSNGDLRDECIKKIEKLGITKSIQFLDKINGWDDLSEIYKSCDIMILPAKFSNGNNTIYESMASGMGIVVSDKVLGSGKRIVNNENGFNCSLNLDEFVKSIKTYIENPLLLTEHGRKNKISVREFAMSKTAENYYNIITKMLNN